MSFLFLVIARVAIYSMHTVYYRLFTTHSHFLLQATSFHLEKIQQKFYNYRTNYAHLSEVLKQKDFRSV